MDNDIVEAIGKYGEENPKVADLYVKMANLHINNIDGPKFKEAESNLNAASVLYQQAKNKTSDWQTGNLYLSYGSFYYFNEKYT